MIAPICKNRRKSKGIPIHNGTHKGGPAAEGGGPPLWGAAEGRPPSWVVWVGILYVFCLCFFISLHIYIHLRVFSQILYKSHYAFLKSQFLKMGFSSLLVSLGSPDATDRSVSSS